MKKVVAILTIAIAMFALASCNKASNNPLANTSWAYNLSESDYSVNATLLFQESTFSMSITFTGKDAPAAQSMKGTYSYVAPKVVLKGENDVVVNGTLDGNKLTLTFPYGEGGDVVFTKLLK